MDRLREFVMSFTKDKKRLIIAAVALVGIILMLGSVFSSDDKSRVALDDYKAELEEEIRELCSEVDGVGKCAVNITFAEGERQQYKSSSIVSTTPPRVLGVAIVCEGAERPDVRSNLTDCMTSLFDIGANRVSVLKMKK